MPTIAVPGGSRAEIVELALQTQAVFPDMTFLVFDTSTNFTADEGWKYIECENEDEMVRLAVESVAQGKADILLKGGVKTHTLLKEVLKKEHQLRKQAVLSHIALVELPSLDRPILLSDSAMNIMPDEEQLALIIENTLEAAAKIGIKKPKVALLSSAENYNPKMPSSVIAKRLTEHFQNHPDAIIYGPLSLDLALSQDAVAHKRFHGPIQGDADILIVPNIDVGNVLYKSLMLFGDAKIGGIISGAKVPIVLTSRSDHAKNKLHALTFALTQIGVKAVDEIWKG